MRDNTSDSHKAVDAEQSSTPPRLHWRELLSKYRQPIGLAVILLLFGLALIACRHMLVEMDTRCTTRCSQSPCPRWAAHCLLR